MVARNDVLEPMAAALDESVALLGAAVTSGDMDGELRCCSAAHVSCWGVVGWEGCVKCSPDVRTGFNKCVARLMMDLVGAMAKAFTDDKATVTADARSSSKEGNVKPAREQAKAKAVLKAAADNIM